MAGKRSRMHVPLTDDTSAEPGAAYNPFKAVLFPLSNRLALPARLRYSLPGG